MSRLSSKLGSLVTGLLLCGTIGAGVTVPVASAAVVEGIWLKIAGLEGDAKSVDHKNEVVLLSYSQSFTHPAPPLGTGGSGGEASCGSVRVTKAVDKSSPGLISRVLRGTLVDEVVITFRSPGDSFDYYKVTLAKAFIDSISQADASATDAPRIL